MVQIHPDPPYQGAIAQLGEHLLCKQGVVGSIPTGSTSYGSVGKNSVMSAWTGAHDWLLPVWRQHVLSTLFNNSGNRLHLGEMK